MPNADNDRRTDTYLRGRLDAIQRGYERWVAYTLRLLAILVMIQLGLGALSVYLVGQNEHRADETRRLLRQVQESREQSVLTTCREQNTRHDRTVHTLLTLIEKFKKEGTLPGAMTKAQLERSVKGNIALIDALAPKEDCKARVARLVTLRPLP